MVRESERNRAGPNRPNETNRHKKQINLPMQKYCPTCDKETEVTVGTVTFANDSSHTEARCAICTRWHQYLPTTQTDQNEMHFGKYKGEKMVDIAERDPEYLVWVSQQPWCKNRLKNIIKELIP